MTAETPTFGRYLVEEQLATGGMAEVFLARLPGPANFSKKVVIKRIRPELAEREDIVQMFTEEAQLAAALAHTNLVQVYELLRVQGTYALVMEYLQGKDLDDVIGERLARGASPPTAAEVAFIVSGAAQGLHHAHTLAREDGSPWGVVHRDVSPSNVFVTRDGIAKVVDFGVAKQRWQEREITGLFRGKPLYASPEQLRTEALDPRSDVFSLGLVAFELLTLEHFYPYDDHARLVAYADSFEPGPRLALESIPRDLRSLLEEMLQPSPDDRIASAGEVARRLEAYLNREGRPFPEDIARSLVGVDGTSRNRVPTTFALGATVRRQSIRRSRWPVVATLTALLVAAGLAFAWIRWAPEWNAAPLQPPVSHAPTVPEPISPDPTPPPAAPVEENNEATEAKGKKSRTKRGRLVLATTPPTDVYLGRRHLGRTPIEVADLPAGKVTVRLKNETPKIGTTAELRIAAGKTTRKHIQLDQGTLMVHVTPWAEVWVDGKKVGTTPIQPVRLYEGRHEVLLTNPKTGRSQRRTVVISAGKTARLSEDLQ